MVKEWTDYISNEGKNYWYGRRGGCSATKFEDICLYNILDFDRVVSSPKK